MRKILTLLIFSAVFLTAFEPKAPKFALTPEIQAVLDGIQASSLRGDLSFLASDVLEGRDTPSRGLDIAAEYIASAFRSAGLEPGGDDGYFQTAQVSVLEPDLTGFALTLSHSGRQLTVNPADTTLNLSDQLDLENHAIFKLDLEDSQIAEKINPAQLAGQVVLIELRRESIRNYRAVARKLRDAKPALVIAIDQTGSNERSSRLVEVLDSDQAPAGPPRITIFSKSAADFYGALKSGASDGVVSAHVAAPHKTLAKVRNVIGILRGSDPALKDTCELLTAHYDHVGMKPPGPGDRIFNGANDDGSGTVSVIEVARALSKLPQHPRRSIVFMTFFGEEEGLLGSRYYAHHPVWPIDKTVAQLNLEQVGRTDSTEGPQISNATLTGFDYSDLTSYVAEAGKLTGIKIYHNSRNSDLYFGASDNLSLAQEGVPAETLCVAFDYPDYHAVGDEWPKVNYDNMAKVDRAVALSLLMVADSDQAPQWNAGNSRTAPYFKAWKERH